MAADERSESAKSVCKSSDLDEPSSAERTCRICLHGEEVSGLFLAPCGCVGSMRWVHEHCLRTWLLTAAQQGRKVSECELCKQQYKGLSPELLRRPTVEIPWVRACIVLMPIVVAVIVLALDMRHSSLVIDITCGLALSSCCFLGRLRNLTNIYCWALLGIMITVIHAWKRYLDFRFMNMEEVPGLHAGLALCYQCSYTSLAYWLPFNPFLTSVVLLTDHSSQGAVGFIINKGFSKPGQPRQQPPHDLGAFTTGYGGPVSTRRGGGWAVLHNGGASVPGARHVNGSAFWVGGDRRYLAALANLSRSSQEVQFHSLAVLGYAGWAPGQLENEIHRNMWTIHNVTPDLVFRTPMETIFSVICDSPADSS